MTIDLHALGFDASKVATHDGSNVTSIQTPFLLFDEFGFDIYVEDRDKTIFLFDEGMTSHSLHALGIDINSRRIEALRNKLSKHQVDVSASGEMSMTAMKEDLPAAFASYVYGLFSVDQWLRNYFQTKKRNKKTLIDQVKLQLRVLHPDIQFTESPSLPSLSGFQYSFDFMVKDVYCDVLYPENCSDFLVKAIDVRKRVGETARLAAFVDDEDAVSAKDERAMNVLQGEVTTVPTSLLWNHPPKNAFSFLGL